MISALRTIFIVLLTTFLLNGKTTHAIDGRIMGGKDAEPGRYAYMVSLQSISRRLSHFCGGTLIAPDIVLTAAHCVRDRDDRANTAVRTRPYQRSNPYEGSEIFAVDEIILHPDYLDTRRTAFAWDIALLKLDGLSLNQPMPVLNQNPDLPFVDQSLTQVGWGDTTNRNGNAPDILQVFENAVFVDLDMCRILDENAPWSLNLPMGDDCICTVEGDGQGVCVGDSGEFLLLPLFLSLVGHSYQRVDSCFFLDAMRTSLWHKPFHDGSENGMSHCLTTLILIFCSSICSFF